MRRIARTKRPRSAPRWPARAGTLIAFGILAHAAPAGAIAGGPSPSAASAVTLKLPDGPGSIRGLHDEASVSVFTGQVAYSLPLDLPHAAQGFGPSLALSYQGGTGNGALGIGWRLPEVSIRRSLRHGVPSYTDADELELAGVGSGGRLVRIDDGSYRVEGHGNSIKVDRIGNRFEVRDSAGTLYVLGATSEGRQEDGARVAAWLAQWITNLGGQKVTLSYAHDRGEVYLDHIVWGPSNEFGCDGVRGDRPDPVISYRTGFRVVTRQRYERFVVRSHGRTLRSYELGYDEVLPLTRLVSVHMTGLDGNLSLPDLRFGYATPEPARADLLENTGAWVLNERGTSLFDVDGDGMADLLRLEAGNHEYRKNQGGTFSERRRLQGANGVDLESAQLMDVDGDARADLVVIVDDTWRAYRLEGERWQPFGELAGTRGVPFHGPNVVLADVNGDGRTDVLKAKTSGIGVLLANASGLEPEVARPAIDPANIAVTPGAADVRFTDVNGDGLIDAVWLTDEWMKIYLGTGDGRFVPHTRAFYPWRNGAGGASIGVLKPNDIVLADLNRDGIDDLIAITDANVAWFPGRPELGTFGTLRKLERPDGVSTDVVVSVSDANGNGSADIVWSSSAGTWVLDLAGGTTAGMLESIDNGLGKSTRIGYDFSAVLSVEAENAGEPWTVKLPVSIPIPVKVTIEPGGTDPERSMEFGVRDGFWDGVERRFGGFLVGKQASIGAAGQETGIVETDFQPGLGEDRVLRGLAFRTETTDALGRTFSIQKSEHQTCLAAGLPDQPLLHTAVAPRAEAFNLEGVAAPVETVSVFEFDSECRPNVERHFGRPDLSDERIVRRTFVDNPALWVRNLVCEERLLEGDDATVRAETRTLYGTDTSVFPLCAGAGFGWVRELDALDAFDGTSRFVTRKSVEYNRLGNPLRTTDDGVRRELGYDPSGIFVETETLPDAGLEYSATWDEVQQLLTRLVEPTGDATEITWDALGRQDTLAMNGAPPYQHFAYDWEPPEPRTTTWVFDGPANRLGAEPWPDGIGWHETIGVSNGAGETRYSATRLADDRWIIDGFTERDERGHERLVAEGFYGSSPLGVARPADIRRNVHHYDALGRMDRRTFFNGAEETVAFAAFEQTTTMQGKAPVLSRFDGLGRLIHTERSIEATGVESADATYDAADRVTSVVIRPSDAGTSTPSVTQSFHYDTLGRLRTADDPDIGHRVLGYDPNLSMLLGEQTNGAGQRVHFDYDGIGRLRRRSESATPDPASDYRYVYDEPGLARAPDCHVQGRLVQVLEPEGEVRFCYDEFGRETRNAHFIRPRGNGGTPPPERFGEMITEYSPSGLELRSTADDGFIQANGFDAAARLVSVQRLDQGGGPAAELWAADEIDGAGRIRREHYGNGVVETYEHDALGLAKDIHVSSGGTDLYHVLVEERTPYGAPTRVTDAIHPGAATGLDQSQTFAYDGAGRLVEATVGRFSSTSDDQYAFAYGYDSLQNMTFRKVCGPKALGELTTDYRYGERGKGPRQLTSVLPETP